MKITNLFIALFFISSCKQDQPIDENVIGAWQHSETLMDIGDGNGSYQKVDSEKTLLFTAYGTVISNQSICIGNNHKDATVATWLPEENKFSVDNCEATYELDPAQETLTVTYQCMEACGEKYIRPN